LPPAEPTPPPPPQAASASPRLKTHEFRRLRIKRPHTLGEFVNDSW
jgi:hypothetical protein